MKSLKQIGYRLLMGNRVSRNLFIKISNLAFPGSAAYWEKRYRSRQGNSGVGSFGDKALYKAEFLNGFVAENKITTVVELGCGDGNQTSYFQFPGYIGLDVSKTAIQKCLERFKGDHSRSFYVFNAIPDTSAAYKAELALALDVVYHLVENDAFENYMKSLFAAASKYVIIYAWDVEEGKKYHVRHRQFTKWINENIVDFKLIDHVAKEPYCDFFVYGKKA